MCVEKELSQEWIQTEYKNEWPTLGPIISYFLSFV